MTAPSRSAVAALVAEFLVARKVDRVFGLQGGHIQPIWDELARRGVRIIDVRDEGAAVHMAHAHAVLSGQIADHHGPRQPHRIAARRQMGPQGSRIGEAGRRQVGGVPLRLQIAEILAQARTDLPARV